MGCAMNVCVLQGCGEMVPFFESPRRWDVTAALQWAASAPVVHTLQISLEWISVNPHLSRLWPCRKTCRKRFC